jgi:hypothetical protein
MSILFDILEFMLAGGCLLGMNFILMLIFGLLRNLPAILHTARQVLREILIMSYRVYRPVIAYLQPITRQYLDIQIGKMPSRIFATGLISLLILLGLDLVLGWNVSIFFSVLAILHGATVGLLWDELEQTEGQRMGENIL